MSAKERLSRIKFYTVKPDLSGFAANELLAIKSCVRASRKINDIFLEQMGPGNGEFLERLSRGTPEQREQAELMRVFGQPWDADNNDAPFVPDIGPRPPGAGTYHREMTEELWQKFIGLASPEQREELESPYTYVDFEDGEFWATPYSELYRDDLQEAAEHLRTAAALLQRGPLERFLRMRADAFLSNDYDPSDRAWVGTDGTPFEVTIGPYEVYADKLAGLKAAFEGFVAIPDREANAALAKFGPAVPEVDTELAKRYGFKPSGSARPLEVVADVFRGGNCAVSPQFIAFNLPNDRRIRTEVGSKNVFSATQMQLVFDHVSQPIAERLLASDDLGRRSFADRMIYVLGHELAHGIGPSTAVVDGIPTDFEKLMGPLHPAIEEAKADTLGTILLSHFVKLGLVDADALARSVTGTVVSYVARWRNGFTKAHERGNLMQYNWMANRKAVHYDRTLRRFSVDPDRALKALGELGHEFIRLQLSGDRKLAEKFVAQWTKVPEGIPELIESLSDLPTRVHTYYDI